MGLTKLKLIIGGQQESQFLPNEVGYNNIIASLKTFMTLPEDKFDLEKETEIFETCFPDSTHRSFLDNFDLINLIFLFLILYIIISIINIIYTWRSMFLIFKTIRFWIPTWISKAKKSIFSIYIQHLKSTKPFLIIQNKHNRQWGQKHPIPFLFLH
jgi:hypothetical protein